MVRIRERDLQEVRLIRGGLLDVYPATEERAIRVDLFDDEIESLRWFSTFTQRSLGDAETVEIAPAAELAAEHRELAEIAALENPDERPDVAELLPVGDFRELLDLLPDHAEVILAAEEDVEPALREAMKLKDRTVFLDVRTDPTENVWPMVQAGKGISEMLLGSEDL